MTPHSISIALQNAEYFDIPNLDKTEPKESIASQKTKPEIPETPPKLQPQPNAPPPQPAQTQSAPVFVGNGKPDNETKEELYHTRKVSHGLKIF